MNPLSKRALWHFIKALTFHPILLLRFFRLQKNALTWYLLPQFIPGYVPKVVTLDTELDDLIPFNPGYF